MRSSTLENIQEKTGGNTPVATLEIQFPKEPFQRSVEASLKIPYLKHPADIV